MYADCVNVMRSCLGDPRQKGLLLVAAEMASANGWETPDIRGMLNEIRTEENAKDVDFVLSKFPDDSYGEWFEECVLNAMVATNSITDSNAKELFEEKRANLLGKQ